MTTVQETAPATDVEELEEQLPALYAPNNTGQLALQNFGGQHLHIHKQVKGLRDAHALGADYVRHTLSVLVERTFRTFRCDVGAAEAERQLRIHHCLVLVGEPGTGRRTAAIGVLGRLGLPLQEIPAWDPGQPGQFSVPDLPAAPGMGLLFRFPAGELAAPDFREQLQSYVGELVRLGSYLVVVVSSTEWHGIGGAVTENVLFVDPPHPRAILTAEVSSRAQYQDLRPLLADERIGALIGQAAPRDVVRLAGLVLAVADRPELDPGPGQQSETTIKDIVGAFQEWDEVLSAWFHHHRAAAERVFLLAAAVLEGAPARLVLRKAEELSEALEGARPSRYDITAAGIQDLARTVEAELIAPGDHLQFRRHAYAEAVLDFFLKDRSDTFRFVLRDWLAKAPGGGRSTEATVVAELVATTVLGIALRHRDIWFLFPIINAWASQRALRPALVSLLTATALSSQVGSQVRERLNRWATYSGSPALCQVVAEVCSGELADAYPQIALTRINNLAVRASGSTIEAVVNAVLLLWRRPRMRRDVLALVFGWLTEPDTRAFAIAIETLSALGPEAVRTAQEHRLATEPGLRNLLWQPARSEQLRYTLYRWLDLAVADPVFADWLVEEIAGAIPGPAPGLLITAIRTFTDAWQNDEAMASRVAFRDRLLDRIAVLGWESADMRQTDTRGAMNDESAV